MLYRHHGLGRVPDEHAHDWGLRRQSLRHELDEQGRVHLCDLVLSLRRRRGGDAQLAGGPGKKVFTRIPPVLADTTSRPACHALRRRTHGGRSKELTPTKKYTKRKPQKNMTDNQQANLKVPSHLLHYTTQRTHARLFLERGAAFFPSFPQLSGEY